MTLEEFMRESSFTFMDKNKYGLDYTELMLVNREEGLKITYFRFKSYELDVLNSYITEIVEAFLNCKEASSLKLSLASFARNTISFYFEMYISSRKVIKSFNYDYQAKEILYPACFLKKCGLNYRMIKKFISRAGDFKPDFNSMYLSGDSVRLWAFDNKSENYESFKIKTT